MGVLKVKVNGVWTDVSTSLNNDAVNQAVWNTSWGIVATAASAQNTLSATAIGITGVINFTPRVGRTYRIHFSARAISGPGGVYYVLKNGGSNDATVDPPNGDWYTSTERNYGDASIDFMLWNGDGVARAWQIWASSAQNLAIYNGSYFVEDMGPYQPTALLPPNTPATTAELARWNSSFGVITRGSFLFTNGTAPGSGSTIASLTTVIVAGRRYRLRMFFNAVAGTSWAGNFNSIIDGTNDGGGIWTWAQGANDNCLAEWVFDGGTAPYTAGTHTIGVRIVQGSGSLSAIYVDRGFFELEDIGPIVPAAQVPPQGATPVVNAANAIGLVAQASVGSAGSNIALTSTYVTVASLTTTLLVGRKYKVVGRSRAITSATFIPVHLAFAGGMFGSAAGESWVQLGSSGFGFGQHEVIVDGDGVAATYLLQAKVSGATTGTFYFDAGSCGFWIEDIGPNQSPALPVSVTPPAWQPVSGMQNGWITPQSAGQPPAQYRKIGDQVYLRGTIGQGTLNTTAFIMPVGFRPVIQEVFSQIGGASTLGCLVINTDGSVVPQIGNNSYYALSGVFYSVTP